MSWTHLQHPFTSSARVGRSSRNSRATTAHANGESQPQSAPRLPRVHDRIDVFWEDCDCAFRGTIVEATRDSGTRFLIQYDDGDLLRQDLDLQRWRFVFPHEPDQSPSDANGTLVGADRNILCNENYQGTNDECHYDSQGWIDVGDLGELLRDHQDSTFNASGHTSSEPVESQRAKRQRTGSYAFPKRRSARHRQHRSVSSESLKKLSTTVNRSANKLEPRKSESTLMDASVGTEQKMRDHNNGTTSAHSHNTVTTALPPTSPASPAHAVLAPSPPPLLLQLQLRAPRTVKGNEMPAAKDEVAFLSTKSPRCLDQFPNVRSGHSSNTPAFMVNNSKDDVVTDSVRRYVPNGCSFKKCLNNNINNSFFQGCASNSADTINEQETIGTRSHSFMLEQGGQNSDGLIKRNTWNGNSKSGANGSDEGESGQSLSYKHVAKNESVACHERKDCGEEHTNSKIIKDPELWDKFREEIVPLRKRLYKHSR